jgi:hypothetical protein
VSPRGCRLTGSAFKAAMAGARIAPPSETPEPDCARVVFVCSKRVEAALSRLSHETLLSRAAILEMALAHYVKTKFPNLAKTPENTP